MVLICCSADSSGPDFCLIFAPSLSYDEPEILRSVHPVKCPKVDDDGQDTRTIRIFSSAENFRRVLRLISFTCLSADPFGPVLVLIINPLKDYDEPETLP